MGGDPWHLGFVQGLRVSVGSSAARGSLCSQWISPLRARSSMRKPRAGSRNREVVVCGLNLPQQFTPAVKLASAVMAFLLIVVGMILSVISRKRRSSSKADTDKLIARAAQSEDERRQLMDLILSRQKAFKHVNEEVKGLEKLIQEAHDKNVGAEIRVTVLKEEIEEKRNQLKEATKETESALGALHIVQGDFEARIARAEEKISPIRDELAKHSEIAERLTEELKESRNKRSSLLKETRKIRRHIEELETELETRQENMRKKRLQVRNEGLFWLRESDNEQSKIERRMQSIDKLVARKERLVTSMQEQAKAYPQVQELMEKSMHEREELASRFCEGQLSRREVSERVVAMEEEFEKQFQGYDERLNELNDRFQVELDSWMSVKAQLDRDEEIFNRKEGRRPDITNLGR